MSRGKSPGMKREIDPLVYPSVNVKNHSRARSLSLCLQLSERNGDGSDRTELSVLAGTLNLMPSFKTLREALGTLIRNNYVSTM